MTIQRWDPFAELRRLDDRFDRFLQTGSERFAGGRWDIPLDVFQEGDDLIVQASLPGVEAAQMSVTLEDGLLTIAGETGSETESRTGNYLLRERRSGRFHSSLRLPNTVDAERAASKHANGVLTITVPKQEAKKARQLRIESD